MRGVNQGPSAVSLPDPRGLRPKGPLVKLPENPTKEDLERYYSSYIDPTGKPQIMH